jgi:hypothetical protein
MKNGKKIKVREINQNLIISGNGIKQLEKP